MEIVFSSRIKELRTSLKLTQAAFAESIGTSQNALSGYENGDRAPSYDILLAIAKKYNISLDWLCGLSGKNPSTHIVSTYADVIELLTTVLSNSTLDIEIIYDTPSTYIGPCEYAPQLGALLFNDSKITTFFREWQDMLRLLNNGTIKESLYKLWLDDQLEKYNEPITSQNIIYGAVSNSFNNDELPFN